MTALPDISKMIWDQKYRLKQFDGTPIDVTVEDSWRRVANSLAQAEKPDARDTWAKHFYDALADFKFLPAGRIASGAGSGRDVTLFNCLGCWLGSQRDPVQLSLG